MLHWSDLILSLVHTYTVIAHDLDVHLDVQYEDALVASTIKRGTNDCIFTTMVLLSKDNLLCNNFPGNKRSCYINYCNLLAFCGSDAL